MKLAALALITTLGIAGAAHAEPARPRDQFRQLLLERFDRNHDGRLEPDERRRAIRTLRRIARRMAIQQRREERAGQVRGRREFRDGAVGPQQVPPGMAPRLRPRDRNDGLDDRAQP